MTNIFANDESLAVALVQCEALDCLSEDDLKNNLEALCQWMERAARAYPGIDLVVFPECSLHGAHPDMNPGLAISTEDPVLDRIKRKCIELKTWAYINILERNNHPSGRPYNTSLLINDMGEIALQQRKINPFVPLEAAIPGDELEVCQGPKGAVFGIMLCYDGDFPEVGRELALKGANVLLRPSSYMEPYSEAWTFVNRARAYENLAYVVAVNRVGTSHVFTWFGKSMAVDFDGRVVTQAPPGVTWLTKVDLDINAVNRARAQYRTCNHLFNLKHRGYTALPPYGDMKNIYSVYKDWT